MDWQTTLSLSWTRASQWMGKNGTVLSLQQADCHIVEHFSAIRDFQSIATERPPSALPQKGLFAVLCNLCCFIVRTMIVIAAPNCC